MSIHTEEVPILLPNGVAGSWSEAHDGHLRVGMGGWNIYWGRVSAYTPTHDCTWTPPPPGSAIDLGRVVSVTFPTADPAWGGLGEVGVRVEATLVAGYSYQQDAWTLNTWANTYPYGATPVRHYLTAPGGRQDLASALLYPPDDEAAVYYGMHEQITTVRTAPGGAGPVTLPATLEFYRSEADWVWSQRSGAGNMTLFTFVRDHLGQTEDVNIALRANAPGGAPDSGNYFPHDIDWQAPWPDTMTYNSEQDVYVYHTMPQSVSLLRITLVLRWDTNYPPDPGSQVYGAVEDESARGRICLGIGARVSHRTLPALPAERLSDAYGVQAWERYRADPRSGRLAMLGRTGASARTLQTSDDGGMTAVEVLALTATSAGIEWDSESGSLVLLYENGGVMQRRVSTDQGATWEAAANVQWLNGANLENLTAQVVDLAHDPRSGVMVLVAKAGTAYKVYTSEDVGKTWAVKIS